MMPAPFATTPSAAAAHKLNSTLQTLARFRSRPAALFRGYTALVSRNLPFTAMQFPIFERLKHGVKQRRVAAGTWTGSLREHALVTAGSAGIAGSVSAVLTTPIDVVKTRVMLDAGEGGGGTGARRESAVQVVRGIVAEKGVRGLWRGGALRGVWTMVGSGLYLGVYDFGRVYLAKRRGVDVSDQDFF
jgi:solute carrier family 25 (mitochondrial S-adenosylmethionine transporter), member 26